MAERDISEIAHERAERYAPMPKLEPSQAGLAGAVIAAISAMVCLFFAGLSQEKYDIAAAWTAVVGFLVPFLYLKNQQRLHWKAWSKEFESMRRSNDA